MNKISSYFFILFWLLPYFLLVPYIKLPQTFDVSDALWAFKNTIYQSGVSAFLIVLFGFLGAQSLNYIHFKYQKYFFVIRTLFILPSFIPTLFILLSVFKIIDPFPFGVWGVALIQWIIYSGLASAIIFNSMQSQVFGLENIALVDGVSARSFFFKVTLPLLRKDLIKLFVVFFSVTFVSFSVPLVAGGGSGTNLEVLIYEKIRIQGDWSGAFLLAFFQVFCIWILSFLNQSQNIKLNFQEHSLFYLHDKGMLIVFLIFPIFIIFSLLSGLSLGLAQLLAIPHLWELLYTTTGMTLLLSILTGLSTMAIAYFILYLFSDKKIKSFLLKYVSPPSSFLCLSLLLIFGFNQNKILLTSAIIFAFVILNTPHLIKTYLISKFENLEMQVEVAQTLGASQLKITHQILWPQMSREIGFISGVSAFWASGDFAIVKFIAGQSITLAQIIESMLSSYRFFAASVLAVLLLILGILLLGIFTRFGYVSYQKFKL